MPKKEEPKLRPVGDHVLVTPIAEDAEMIAPGGMKFLVPETAQDKPNRGTVVATGDGRILQDGKVRKIALEPGQKVLFSKYAGNEFSLGPDKYIILSYDDILVILP